MYTTFFLRLRHTAVLPSAVPGSGSQPKCYVGLLLACVHIARQVPVMCLQPYGVTPNLTSLASTAGPLHDSSGICQ